MEQKCIKVIRFKPYRIEIFRPNCELSRLFAELLKQKSLTREDIEAIKRIGFEIIEECA